MEYGLPPTAGWGVGVDRLTMFLSDKVDFCCCCYYCCCVAVGVVFCFGVGGVIAAVAVVVST